MGMAQLVVTAVLVEGRSKSEVARAYGLSRRWVITLVQRYQAEGEPGRLASISLGVGVVWGAVWLLSAMFNSAAILLATTYQDGTGARLMGVLGKASVLILTPSILFVLTLAVSFVSRLCTLTPSSRTGRRPASVFLRSSTARVAMRSASCVGCGSL